MKTNDGRLIVIAGASRSGKTAYTERRTRAARRVVAYDPEAQWCDLKGWRKVASRADLWQAIQAPGRLRLAYVPGGDIEAEFDYLCECVLYAARYIEPLDFVAEELADVSRPGKAPPGWGMLVRRGLKRGVTIYAISQRWAEADKTAVGNASEFVLFRMSSGDDVRYMSRKTRVEESLLDVLKPLEYVQYDAGTGAVSNGRLRF